ncbi:hypothetical protein QYG89_12200 [Bacillus sp. B190/17]|uniref:Uncharacterized protein n=1 Tax=Bacillus lumedeiriae TaxID=3058829 RepID=A0ABW8ICP3_9BACI
MEKLTEEEQIVLAYYIQYYQGNDPNDIAEMHEILTKGMPSYPSLMNELAEEKLLNGSEAIPSSPVENGREKMTKPMITNKGVMHIDNILDIQSYAVEKDKLSYIKSSILTNDLELSSDVIEAYVKTSLQIQ